MTFGWRLVGFLIAGGVAIFMIILIEFLNDVLPSEVGDYLQLFEKVPYLDKGNSHIGSLCSKMRHENH